MSREILFKGKRTDNCEWVEGYFGIKDGYSNEKIYCIMKPTFDMRMEYSYFTDYEVIPETVGQYTGLTDNNRKNKKKIFEGDIVKAYFNFNPTDFVIGKVIFEYGTFKIRVTGTKKNGEFSKYTDDNIKAYAIENNFINRGYLLEVIGNIHDNPELLN